MVSSKCCAVVSPSPLRFFAALMPPCAQTECERFTGTIENRSTVPPASAILITAASPASPPPITMILGAAIESFLSPCNQVKHTVRLELSDDNEHCTRSRGNHLNHNQSIGKSSGAAGRKARLVVLEQLHKSLVADCFAGRCARLRRKLCSDPSDNNQPTKRGYREGDETTPNTIQVCHISLKLQC